jgi:PAS domain S-box-containing protein
MKARLQLKYSLAIAALVTGVALIVSSLLLYQFSQLADRIVSTSDQSLEHALNRQFINRGKALTSFLAETLINPLHSFDATEIHRLLRIALSNEDVRFVHVFDPNGKIIHDGFEHIPSYGELIDDPNAARVLENENLYIRFYPARIDVAMPVVFDDGKRLGSVRVGLSLDRVKKEIQASKQHLKTLSAENLEKNLYFVVMVVTTLVCLGVVGAMRIARGLSRPIGELARLSTNIGQGDFHFPITIERSDEIGELTHSFRRMAADLTRTTVSREYLHRIIDHMGDLLVVVDSEGTIKKINRKVCTLLHYSETDLTDAPIETLFPRLESGMQSPVCSSDRVSATETICRHQSGEQIPVSLSVSRLGKEGGVEQRIFVARDIRERKEAERNVFRLAYFDALTFDAH